MSPFASYNTEKNLFIFFLSFPSHSISMQWKKKSNHCFVIFLKLGLREFMAHATMYDRKVVLMETQVYPNINLCMI